MKRLAASVAVAALVAAGCQLLHKGKLKPKPMPPTFSQFHQEGWSWDRVDRVIVLPFLNESQYTRAGFEVRDAFTSDMQRLGRFEVVSASTEPEHGGGALAAAIHRGGRFDEAALLAFGRYTNADVIVHGIVTHYSPYPRPRLGLILQAVAPRQAKVVASVDGLWDTTDCNVAERCRTYYRQRSRPYPFWIRNNRIATEDVFASELALQSPMLFQRWVCQEASLALLGLPVPGVISPAGVSQGVIVQGPISPDLNSKASGATGSSAAPQPGCPAPQPAAPAEKVK